VILLDTNVLSAFMRAPVDAVVRDWLDRQPRSSIWTTTITVFEVNFGLATLPQGRRRDALSQAFDVLINEELNRRVAVFDFAAAEQTAALVAARRRAGAQQDLRDSMIAGIALARRATLATRNTRHFADAGITLIDSWALT
jgi:predicted nucleic acid-binding protein